MSTKESKPPPQPIVSPLRDHFAAAAIAGVATHGDLVNLDKVARRAYEVADVMLKIREDAL